jgi:hypothetical protein
MIVRAYFKLVNLDLRCIKDKQIVKFLLVLNL